MAARILLETGTDALLLETGDTLRLEEFFFDDARQAIIDGIDSAQSEGTGWDALRSSIALTSVVRTSATVVTITLPALAGYDITATETLTVTVPSTALVGAVAIVATPTLTITVAAGIDSPTRPDFRRRLRPAQFAPMSDAVRPAKYWRFK
jgi:hypothetical protein